MSLGDIKFDFSNLNPNQLSIFQNLNTDALQSYMKELQSISNADYGNFDSSIVQKYANAIADLESSQGSLLLSTQGLTNAQIAETLSLNESDTAKNYQAMLDAGLLKSKQSLTAAQVQSNLQTVLGTDVDTSAAMASLGLSAAMEGEESQMVQLTSQKLEEATASGTLTQTQAQEMAMRSGITAATNAQNAVMPKWISSLKTSALATWEQVKATAAWLMTNPAGWATLAVGALVAVIAGIHAYNKSIDEAVDNARENLAETEEQLASISSEKEKVVKQLKELEAMEKNGSLSLTDKADLEILRQQNEELRIRQMYLNKQQEKDNKKLEKASKKKYNRDYGYQETTRESIEGYKEVLAENASTNSLPANPYVTGNTNPSYTPYVSPGMQAQQLSIESTSLAALIAKYEYYTEEKKKALQSDDTKAVEKYDEKLTELGETLFNSRIELQDFADDLSVTGESSQELDDVNNKLQLIDETLYSREKDAIHFINDNALQLDKKRLVELAETGKLTDTELSKNFGNISAYLKESGLSIQDLIPALKSYKDELISTPSTLDENNALTIDSAKDNLYRHFVEPSADLDKTSFDSVELRYRDWMSKFNDEEITILYSIMNDTDTSGWSFDDFDKELVKRENSPFLEVMTDMDDISGNFSMLKDVFDDLTDSTKEVTFDKLPDLSEKFKDMAGIQSYIKAIMDANGETQATQEAFNDLTNAYIKQTGILDQVTDGNATLIQSYLTEQGIANANQLVQEALGQKKAEAAWASRDLSNATADEIIALMQEAGVTGIAESAFASYIVQKMMADMAMDPTADITALASIVESLGIATDAWQKYVAVKNRMAEIAADPNYASYDEYGNIVSKEVVLQQYGELARSYSEDMKKDASAILSKISDKPKAPPSGVGNNTGGQPEKDTQKDYDWLERATTAINRERSKSQELIDDETLSYHEQISALQELISLDNQLVDITAEAQAAYTDRWDEITQKMIEVFGEVDGNQLISKIKKGDTSLEGSMDSFGSEQSELLDKAIKAYDDMNQAEDEYENAVKERTGHIREQYAKRAAEVEAYVSEVSSALSDAQSRLDLKDTTGREITEADYRQLISLSKNQVRLYYEQIDALEDQLSTVEEFGPEYYSIKSSIASCESSIIDAEKAQAEWNEEIKNLPIRKLERYLSILKNIKSDLQNWIDEQSVLGVNATSEQFQQLIDISKKQIDKLLEQQKLYKDNLSDYQWNSDKYNETAASIQDIDDEISGLIQSQKEWNREILNIPINSITGLNEQLKSVSSAMGQVIDDYNTVVDTVIESIDRQKKAVEDSYNAQMDAIDEKINTLQKEKEEQDSLLKVEQARADLERQKQQRTNKVLRNGTLQYEADIDAVRDAQINYENAKYDKQISDLNSAKDALQEALDKELEALDSISEKWSQIADDIKYAANSQLTEQILGSGWKEQILSGNGDDMYQLFRKNFETLATQQEAYDKQIASNENLISLMQTYVDAYLEGSISYEQAVTAMQNIAANMKDGFSNLDNLNAVLGTMTGEADSSLSSALSDINHIFEHAGEYFKSAQSNNQMLETYAKTWEEMKADVAAQLKELEELSKKVAEIHEESKKNSGGGTRDSDKNNISHGTIYADGTLVVTNPDVSGHYTGDGKDLNRHHAGLYSGPVGTSGGGRLEQLKDIVELAPGEVPIIARRSEVLLTPDQIEKITRNFSALTSYRPSIPLPISSIPQAANKSGGTQVNFEGDIVLQGVQDPDGLAKALKMNFRSAMRQRMSE